MSTNTPKKLKLVKRVAPTQEVESNTSTATPIKTSKSNGRTTNIAMYISATVCICLTILVSLYFIYRYNPNATEKIKTDQESDISRETKREIDKLIADGFIYIEGGVFNMGSSDEGEDEGPVHEESVISFYLNKYEVTQSLWLRVMGGNPSHFRGENRPVESVSWFEAINFCNALSEQEGLQTCYTIYNDKVTFRHEANGYRLPTETEWEYAAKGGEKKEAHTYSGSYYANEVAWYNNNSSQTTHDVGLKSPNRLGLYDMSGNVYEWCANCYTPKLVTNADSMLNNLSFG